MQGICVCAHVYTVCDCINWKQRNFIHCSFPSKNYALCVVRPPLQLRCKLHTHKRTYAHAQLFVCIYIIRMYLWINTHTDLIVQYAYLCMYVYGYCFNVGSNDSGNSWASIKSSYLAAGCASAACACQVQRRRQRRDSNVKVSTRREDTWTFQNST